jgi:hypothetical protein
MLHVEGRAGEVWRKGEDDEVGNAEEIGGTDEPKGGISDLQ